MDSKLQDILDDALDAMCRQIDPDHGLLRKLLSERVLSADQIDSCKAKPTRSARVEEMVNCLKLTNDAAYTKFREILLKMGQGQFVTNRLPPNEAELAPQNVDNAQHNATPIMTDHAGTNDARIPSATVVSAMRKEVTDKNAYDVGYHLENPWRKRGRMLIIANSKFSDEESFPERKGTNADLLNLSKLSSYLKFDVQVKENLTVQQIKDVCIDESRSNEQSSIFALFVLSHGENGVVCGTDGSKLGIEEMMSLFDGKNCKHLIDKPKLFFVQACQGGKRTEGVSKDDGIDGAPQTGGVVRRHEKADMALVLASPPGYAAWRNGGTGSYFVTCLTNVLFDHAHEQHFDPMMKQVTQEMNKLEMGGGYKQVTQLVSTLDKNVWLLPY